VGRAAAAKRGRREERLGVGLTANGSTDRIIRFCAVFVALQVATQALYYGLFLNSRPFQVYLHLVAASAAAVLRLLGRGVTCEFDMLHGGFDMSIRSGCDGLQAMAIFASAVVAYPASWTRRTQGLLAGVASLLGINIVRIATLFLVGAEWPQHFESAHVQVWPALLILCAVLLWAAWASRATSSPQTA
jgi:exosortase/archaeosortase family protein